MTRMVVPHFLTFGRWQVPFPSRKLSIIEAKCHFYLCNNCMAFANSSHLDLKEKQRKENIMTNSQVNKEPLLMEAFGRHLLSSASLTKCIYDTQTLTFSQLIISL